MKPHKFLSIIILFLTLMLACEKNEDNEERLSENLLTMDGVKVLNNVLLAGFYTKVRYISESIAYTITSDGKIFKTEDAGYNWTQQESGTESNLTDIFFFDDLHGYIVGYVSVGQWEGVILKTINGGNTWISTKIQSSNLYNIHFINKETGIATGNKLFKTQDSGETWNEVDWGYFTYGDINFYDERTGFLGASIYPSGNILLMTTDSGNNWMQLKNESANIVGFNKIQILNGTAYFSGNSGEVFKTSNSGDTWETIYVAEISSTYFINEIQSVGGWTRVD